VCCCGKIMSQCECMCRAECGSAFFACEPCTPMDLKLCEPCRCLGLAPAQRGSGGCGGEDERDSECDRDDSDDYDDGCGTAVKGEGRSSSGSLARDVVEDGMHADIADHEAIVDSGRSKGMVSKKRLENFKTLLRQEYPELY
ncbi:unnamed protein product, partial [Prorocentrum cordatum]